MWYGHGIVQYTKAECCHGAVLFNDVMGMVNYSEMLPRKGWVRSGSVMPGIMGKTMVPFFYHYTK